jgi:hypothetical protein
MIDASPAEAGRSRAHCECLGCIQVAKPRPHGDGGGVSALGIQGVLLSHPSADHAAPVFADRLDVGAKQLEHCVISHGSGLSRDLAAHFAGPGSANRGGCGMIRLLGWDLRKTSS